MTPRDADRLRDAALSLRGKRVVVAGLGLFGGGAAAARYAAAEGADVLVTDVKAEADLAEPIRSLGDLHVDYRLGGHVHEDFESADLVVANPAIPFRSEYLQAAIAAGVPVTTEVGLFAARFPGRTIAVTGTSGKTTTATMIGLMVANAFPDTIVGGNMGVSLLRGIEEATEHTTAVLELSSFQLRYLGMMAWRPDVAVVTNFAPNHLDIHDGLDDYRDCKRQLIVHQAKGDTAVLNAMDAEVWGWGSETAATVVAFGVGDAEGDGVFAAAGAIHSVRGGRSQEMCAADDLVIRGSHNVENACAASAAGLAAGVDPMLIAEVLATFPGVEHRLERCGEVDGVTYVNDSIATSPERTMVALDAIDTPIVLIAGGSDKGLDYSALGHAVDERVKRLILIGQTADAIASRVSRVPVDRCDSLDSAVRAAASAAAPGDTVLLSPASASYDMFDNFESRGRTFKALVTARSS